MTSLASRTTVTGTICLQGVIGACVNVINTHRGFACTAFYSDFHHKGKDIVPEKPGLRRFSRKDDAPELLEAAPVCEHETTACLRRVCASGRPWKMCLQLVVRGKANLRKCL